MSKSKKYFIYTWGCAANVADSERVAGFYESNGWQKAKTFDKADEIIFVTCSVRKSAEDRVLGLVKNINDKFKTKKRKPKLILTGCMLHHSPKRLKELFPDVDEFSDISHISFATPSIRSDRKHALIPISSGCNSFCTYCIVPLARDREKSRPESEILAEIKCLVDKGYEEFTLLGQNVNSFGLEKIGMSARKFLEKNKKFPTPQSQYKAFSGRSPFSKLLEKICQISGVKKIHFMSSNPWDFYDDIIDIIAQNPQIDRYFHIALQSGDDRILAKMNRGYTAQQYLQLIKKIKSIIPDAEIGTDIIVGFPGETAVQFNNTVKICKKIKFKIAYINKYSQRPGTACARLYPDDITPQEKKRRWQILENLINKPNLK